MRECIARLPCECTNAHCTSRVSQAQRARRLCSFVRVNESNARTDIRAEGLRDVAHDFISPIARPWRNVLAPTHLRWEPDFTWRAIPRFQGFAREWQTLNRAIRSPLFVPVSAVVPPHPITAHQKLDRVGAVPEPNKTAKTSQYRKSVHGDQRHSGVPHKDRPDRDGDHRHPDHPGNRKKYGR